MSRHTHIKMGDAALVKKVKGLWGTTEYVYQSTSIERSGKASYLEQLMHEAYPHAVIRTQPVDVATGHASLWMNEERD